MKFEGRLLLFDTLDKNNYIFKKSCNITFPEKISFTWDFYNVNNPNLIVGYAIVKRDDIGLIVEGEITNELIIKMIKEGVLHLDSIGIGGYYNKVKTNIEESIVIEDSAFLRFMAFTTTPVNENYKIKLKED